MTAPVAVIGLRDGEVRREVITIRARTLKREPIRLIVSQFQDKEGRFTLCVITQEGKIHNPIESPRFAADYGRGWIHAGMISEKWNRDVNGVR